jgi:hypothetical protein
MDIQAGPPVVNHADTPTDALIDRMKAATEELSRQAGDDFQWYAAGTMRLTSVASVPFLQAARTSVKGYEHLHGYKVRFKTTWLEKP